MRFFYEGSFLTSGINDIPDGAIPLSEGEFLHLLSSNASGLEVSTGDDGCPILIDPSSKNDDAIMAARARRDSEINGIEWLFSRHEKQKNAGLATTLSESQFEELIEYYKSLCDWPSQMNWPDIDMPTKPEWLS